MSDDESDDEEGRKRRTEMSTNSAGSCESGKKYEVEVSR